MYQYLILHQSNSEVKIALKNFDNNKCEMHSIYRYLHFFPHPYFTTNTHTHTDKLTHI